MADDDDDMLLSPTVLQVIDSFAAAMRADADLDGDAIGRLEKLIREGTIPKPDAINAALFDPPPEDQG